MDLQKRFVEIRYEGDRKISGTAMRYGDVAEIWGELEKFEQGAFGNVGSQDVLLNFQHDQTKLLCRTGGGGFVNQ